MTFREAMSSFPSGVTVVTTMSPEGEPVGFTATSFASVSLNPPLVSVCLDRNAQSHGVFAKSDSWMIHFLDQMGVEMAMTFATRGADKFAGGAHFVNSVGLPQLSSVPVSLRCSRFGDLAAGDHDILIGLVEHVEITRADPLVYWARNFHRLAPLDEPGVQTAVDWRVLNTEGNWAPSYGMF